MQEKEEPTAGTTDPEASAILDKHAPATGRHRHHRTPARNHALKVLYGDDEWSVVVQAAHLAGLRPSSYVATTALAAAEQVVHHETFTEQGSSRRGRAATTTPTADRELLAELVQARLALRRFAVNANQAAAVLNTLGKAPPWLEQAVAGAVRAVERIHTAAGRVAMRLR
jgi:uncharacterized protein (DUF1778 family)